MDDLVSVHQKKKLICTVVLLSILLFVLIIIFSFELFDDAITNLIDPENGRMSVVSSLDKKEQIIIIEGKSAFVQEIRFYYKRIGESKEYKIGEIKLTKEQYSTIDDYDYEVIWLTDGIEVKLRFDDTKGWKTYKFDFSDLFQAGKGLLGCAFAV